MDPAKTHQIPTRTRFSILLFLFISVVINYMDRANISIAGTAISNQFNLTSVQLGFVFSAFGWTYVALQIPGGLLADRFGSRVLYAVCLVSWSLVTLLQGVAGSFTLLILLRLLVGALEAPSYPINNRIVTTWFPESERATSIAVYTSGQYVGLAFLTPAMAALEFYFGWRGLFIITGFMGILWGIVWYFLYRDPSKHTKVNEEELRYIQSGGGLAEDRVKKNTAGFTWTNIRQVFSHRKLWGIYLGQYAVTSTLWFFLTWFPVYLVKYRGLNFLKTGFLASIPFLAAFAGILLSGYLSDLLTRKKFSPEFARKTPVITGLLLSSVIVGANYVDSPELIILFLSVAFFGNGMASITWVFVSLLAPRHLVGITGGAFNFIGNLSSVSVPFIIGFLVEKGSFEPALIFISFIALCGVLSYSLLVGKIERVQV